MAFKKPEIHTIKPDIKNAYVYLRAVRKWGKTTTWRELILQKYNGDASRGLLIEVGNEHGTTMLDNINMTHVATYKEMVELKDWLISTKGKEHNIEMLCFDVVDELQEIFDKEVCRLATLENPQKPCKSIKSAWGGYNAGPEMSANKIKEYMESLKNAGFGIFCIGHTKMKAVSDKATTEDEKWMTLTGNLSSNYEAAIADVCDIIVTGNVEREFEIKGEGESAKRYMTSEERRLYFRGTELINAGGRFAPDTVPDYIVFDGNPAEFAKKLIDTIETGMEKSKTTTDKPTSKKKSKVEETSIDPTPEDESIEEPVVEEDITEDIGTGLDTTDDIFEEEINVAELVSTIRSSFKASTDAEAKKAVKAILASNGGKLSEDMPVESIKEIANILGV